MAAQFGALQPVHGEQCPLDPADLLQRQVEPVLLFVAAELLQHHRGCHGAGLDRGRQANDVVPTFTDQVDPDRLTEQRFQSLVLGCRLDRAEPPVADVS